MPAKRTRETGIVPIDHDKLTVEKVVNALESGTKITIVGMESDDMSNAITRRKASAKTAEELLQPLELVKAKDNDAVLGKPIQLRGVGVRNSDDAFMQEEGGLGIYVVLDTSIGPIGTGSADIVVTALRLVELKALPQWVKITQTVSKSSGRKVLNLVGCTVEEVPETPF